MATFGNHNHLCLADEARSSSAQPGSAGATLDVYPVIVLGQSKLHGFAVPLQHVR